MSLRLEMLQVARLAPRLLGESTGLVRAFLWRQQNPDGGFKNRLGQSDLYYSVFGIEALLALTLRSGDSLSPSDSTGSLHPALPRLESYLRKFGAGEALDLVHLCCLIRCWADVVVGSPSFRMSANRQSFPTGLQKVLPQRLETYRSKDGGYNPIPGSDFGTAYGGFLMLGAYQDLGIDVPNAPGLARSLAGLQHENGAWDNTGPALFKHSTLNTQHSTLASGATNATAAAVATLQHLSATFSSLSPSDGERVGVRGQSAASQWLLARCHPQGGFLAGPNAPLPDLLSTATALHALAGLQVPLEPIRERCLDFLDSLWTNEGSFHGHWLDETLDCEYTFYALLALGHLSLSN